MHTWKHFPTPAPPPFHTLQPTNPPFSGDHKLSGDPERNCLAMTHLKCAENKIKIKTKEKNGNTLYKSRDLIGYEKIVLYWFKKYKKINVLRINKLRL